MCSDVHSYDDLQMSMCKSLRTLIHMNMIYDIWHIQFSLVMGFKRSTAFAEV